MDQLPTDLQEALRKTNTERLRIMAAKMYDVGDEELVTMDRTALLDVVATDIVARRGATSRRMSEKSDQVRQMELQLELKRMELEQRGMEIQAETENKRIEAENRALEVQNEREKREHELRMAEAGRLAERDERGGYDDQNMEEDGGERGRPRVEPRHPRVETLADRVKRYDSALKQVVSPMPSNATEIPQFFESLKAMFRSFEIPSDLRAKLLLPFLFLKAKSLISRLNAEELEDYEGVRDFLLSEFKLTPREYLVRFDNAAKRPDETFIYFAARLRNNLRYYLRSRDTILSVCFLF